MKWFYLLIPFFLLLTACKKETTEKIPFKKIDTGVQGNLNALCMINKTLLIAGGEHLGNGRVIYSNDEGQSWSMLPGQTEGAITALLMMDSLTWYAGTSAPHAYKTVNGGMTWDKLWVNTAYAPQYRKPVRQIVKTTDSTLYFVLGGDFEAGGIWKTCDAGTTWKAHTFNFELRSLAFENFSDGLACGFGNMIKTNDGGETWIHSPCSNDYFTGLQFDENKKWWSVSFNGGVYSSTNPASGWSERLNAARIFSGRKNFKGLLWDEDVLILFGENGWLVTGNVEGKEWKAFSCCNENSIRALLKTGNHYTACGRNGEIYLVDRKRLFN